MKVDSNIIKLIIIHEDKVYFLKNRENKILLPQKKHQWNDDRQLVLENYIKRLKLDIVKSTVIDVKVNNSNKRSQIEYYYKCVINEDSENNFKEENGWLNSNSINSEKYNFISSFEKSIGLEMLGESEPNKPKYSAPKKTDLNYKKLITPEMLVDDKLNCEKYSTSPKTKKKISVVDSIDDEYYSDITPTIVKQNYNSYKVDLNQEKLNDRKYETKKVLKQDIDKNRISPFTILYISCAVILVFMFTSSQQIHYEETITPDFDYNLLIESIDYINESKEESVQVIESAETYYSTCDEVKALGLAPIYNYEAGYRPALDSDLDGKACEITSSSDSIYDQTYDVYYANCSEVRAYGAAPIRFGDPGYSSRLDRDGDGTGCE